MNLIDELNAICDAGVPPISKMLREMDVDGYLDFIERCYQVTHEAEPRLVHAVKVSTLPDLREKLAQMLPEERDHYKLAEEDLAMFGRKPPKPNPPAVRAFDEVWFGVDTETQLGFASILFVFEGVTPRIAADVAAARKRLDLSDEQTRFFREHIAADDEHAAMFGRLCEKYAAEHGETMIRLAREAMPHITAMAL
jgi:heme oxygenase